MRRRVGGLPRPLVAPAGVAGVAGAQGPRWAVYEVRGVEAPPHEAVERLGAWLCALERPVQFVLRAERLAAGDVRPLGGASAVLDPSLLRLSHQLAAAGLVRRRLYLAVGADDPGATRTSLGAAGFDVEPVDARTTADLVRRLLGGTPLPDGLEVDEAGGTDAPGGRPLTLSPRDAAAPAAVANGSRTWHEHLRPDRLAVSVDHVVTDAGAVALLYIDGLPREVADEGLADALSLPDALDVSVRLWPLPAEQVVRYLSRRLRDLRSSQALAPGGEVDYRLPTAVADAERLREAVYVGTTKLLHAQIIVAVRGIDRAEALAAAAGVRARLSRLGYLARAAVWRQWPALCALLPGTPDTFGGVLNVTNQAAARLVPLTLVPPFPEHGVLLGRDRVRRAPVHLDRGRLSNPAALYLGAPGSGKSTLAKMEILRAAGRTPTDRFVVVDPEGEYGRVVQRLPGGVAVDVSQPGDIRLPLLAGSGRDDNPALRAARAATLLVPVLGIDDPGARLHLTQAIDALLARPPADLADLPDMLAAVDPDLANRTAHALAGPLRILAGRAAPEPRPRAMALDLREVDSTVLPALLPALTEALIASLHDERGDGLLWLTLDEFHLFLAHAEGARLLVALAKRARKRGIVLTAVTQHLVDLVRHPDGEAILSAVETVALFRPGVDLAPFATTLAMRDEERSHAQAMPPGEALLRSGGRTAWVEIHLSDDERRVADTRPHALRGPVQPHPDAEVTAHGPAR